MYFPFQRNSMGASNIGILLGQIPKEEHYSEAVQASADFFKVQKRTIFAVYGSMARHIHTRESNKSLGVIRGLSDIDIFTANRGGKVPKFDSLLGFGTLQKELHPNIPIQCTWTTRAACESILTPSSGYMDEVIAGSEAGIASRDFASAVTSWLPENTLKNDDIAMLSHFTRKVIASTIRIPGARKRLEYREIMSIYEAYKKIFSIMCLVSRLLTGKSTFRKSKQNIIQEFQKDTENAGIEVNLNMQVLLDFYAEISDFEKVLYHFATNSLEEVQESFRPMYAEFEKIQGAILALPFHVASRI